MKKQRIKKYKIAAALYHFCFTKVSFLSRSFQRQAMKNKKAWQIIFSDYKLKFE